MTDDPEEIQRHRLIGATDDGVVYHVPRIQFVTIASLRVTNMALSHALASLDERFNVLTTSMIDVMKERDRLAARVEELEAQQGTRNRSNEWSG